MGIYDEFVKRGKHFNLVKIVMVRCSDNSSYHGDILVGADGAYSALKRNDSFRNSEWGPEATEALAREVRPFKVLGGKDGKQLTLGDGSGAITAIHDAVTLANWLSTLRFAGEKKVRNVFKEYRTERYPVAKEAFKSSQMFTRNVGKSVLSVLVRATVKRLPHWLWKRIVIKVLAARHQASFLPLVEDNAPVKPMYQRSLHRTLAIHKEQMNSSIVATGASVSALVTA
ncbi:hypothetical protein BG003_009547 [Podila horticola]|nr:hypothetical protein BG003_009547 [Podila horticola]